MGNTVGLAHSKHQHRMAPMVICYLPVFSSVYRHTKVMQSWQAWEQKFALFDIVLMWLCVETKLKVEDLSLLPVLQFPGPLLYISEDSVTPTFFCTVSPQFRWASATSDSAALGHSSGERLNLHPPLLLLPPPLLLHARGISSLWAGIKVVLYQANL